MNNPFSTRNPNLQLAWDASSLKAYQFCPRYYQHTNLEGWRGSSVDLEFGGLIASGFERFKKARLNGKSIEDALVETVRWALTETFFEASNEDIAEGVEDHQWGGRYETMWKCEGTEPYKNAKGNRAKCPFAHEKAWFPGDAPDVCGECRSATRIERRYLPNHTAKNRQSLIRTIIWYGLQQPENLEDGYRPYVFPDGTPAVELSGRMPLPWKTEYGEQYLIAWNFDYIGAYGDELFITDNKTTSKTLDTKYFAGFNPDTQFDTYDLVASVAFPDLPIKGVMVDAAQILVGGSEFGLHPYYKNEEQREEHLGDMREWIKSAERNAENNYWPMNKRNCWLCPLKAVCSLPKSRREGFLASNFEKKERWNPLRER